ncbi:hypothetical protein NQZ68_015737 [Dissostichus eleginoides]|nr:hypothetical protein NQZ68_015737 [Dissostichus eleginoides]
MNQNHQHRQEDKQRITQSVIKLLPSITERILVFLATTLNSSSLSSSSSSLFSSSMEMTNPSWTSTVTTKTSRNALLAVQQ